MPGHPDWTPAPVQEGAQAQSQAQASPATGLLRD
jgi:hypothetical protein